MSEEQTVLYSEDNHVALVSLNRPQQMNASSYALREGLAEALAKAENNPNIRVVVLTGEGRGFSSGADLSESFTEHHSTISQHILKDHKPFIDQIAASEKAYIAALNGATAGVMIGYAFACDIVMMAESAYVFSPFTGIGLVPDGGVSWFLVRALGYQRAFEVIAEHKRLTSEECLKAGLVNQVTPDDELRDAAIARAHVLANESAPLTVRYVKKLLRFAENGSREDTTILEAEFQHIVSRTEDFGEGVAAFMQKRKPEFKGK